MDNHKQFFDSFEFETFTTNIKLEFPHELNLSKKEERYFIFLFSRSLSLSKYEKIRILVNFKDLSVFQVTKLTKTLEEERTAFTLLSSENNPSLDQISEMKFEILKKWKEIEQDMIQFQNFNTKVKLASNSSIKFNEKYFLYRFAYSLSLNGLEKKDILINRFPKFSQFQIDELIMILEEEKEKFDDLALRSEKKVNILRENTEIDWYYVESLF
jgi:hypothetical protein